METINIHQAKTHLSRLVERAARGEAFVIAKAGKPLVKVVPLDAPEPADRQLFGFMRDEIVVPDDFDTIARGEIETLFGGAE